MVVAISNALAAVKFAPLRSSDRASATAAYEHDEDAIPNPVEATMALISARFVSIAGQIPARPLHSGLYPHGVFGTTMASMLLPMTWASRHAACVLGFDCLRA